MVEKDLHMKKNTRLKYTDKFETFWKVYPRSDGKYNALKAWLKNGIEDDAFLPTQITGDVEKRTRLKYWPHDKTKVPHGSTWLNGRRWEDEAWEDEIKTHGKESASPSMRTYTPSEDTSAKLSPVAAAANLWLFRYIRIAGGLIPDRLRQAVRIKNHTVKELEPAILEEIANDESQRGAMRVMFAETILHRFDLGLALDIRDRVLTGNRL